MPDSPKRRIWCLRASQELKSPITLTLLAFGAHTPKSTPLTPFISIKFAPNLL